MSQSAIQPADRHGTIEACAAAARGHGDTVSAEGAEARAFVFRDPEHAGRPEARPVPEDLQVPCL